MLSSNRSIRTGLSRSNSSVATHLFSRRSTVKVSAIGKQDVVEYMANKLNIPKIKANETLNVLLDLIKEEASKQIISSLL